MDNTQVDALLRRIINHLRSSGLTMEVPHLWIGYLAALLERGILDHQSFMALGRLVGTKSSGDCLSVRARPTSR